MFVGVHPSDPTHPRQRYRIGERQVVGETVTRDPQWGPTGVYPGDVETSVRKRRPAPRGDPSSDPA